MEYIYNHLGISALYGLFLVINLGIINSDIKHRKIQNNLLISLGLMLPIWYIMSDSIINNTIMAKYILAGFILVIGIMAYGNQKNMLGSGDIKYSAILVLFLINHSLVIFLGNISIFTLLLLAIWWIYSLGYILFFAKTVEVSMKNELFGVHLYPLKILKIIGSIILDWIIIGFFISTLLNTIHLWLFQIIPSGQEFYFLISLSVFFIRPMIRKLLTGNLRIITTSVLTFYFIFLIRETGFLIFINHLGNYIINIWYFVIIISGVHHISIKLFKTYDLVFKRVNLRNDINITFPYSVILFISFCILYFFNINLMGMVLRLLTT